MLLALCLRLAAYALSGGILHSDEIFQYAEQAHRLVFGQGIVPWEYRAGIRSWLFPGLLAGVMEVARVVGSGPVMQNAAVAVFLSLLSLPAVACCIAWGRVAAGAAGGVAAGVLAAAWSEAVLISIHPLLDGVGLDCLVPAVFLLQRAGRAESRSVIAWAGCLLGLTLAFRLQLAPAALWCWLRLWACVPLLLSGMLDWVTLGCPFQSVLRYAAINSRGAADFFGTAPWDFYLRAVADAAGWLAPVMALCICFGIRRLPLLAEAAGMLLLTFSLVPHKEVRFILPAYPFLLTLAGAGSARLAGGVAQRFCWRQPRRLPAVLAAAWIVLCAVHVRSPASAILWIRGTAIVAEMHRAAADPAACALAIVSAPAPSPWYVVGGLTHLRPGMDLVAFDPAMPPGHVTGFDYAIAPSAISLSRWGLRVLECRPATAAAGTPAICLWHNAGGCAGPRRPEIQLPDPPFLRPR